MLHLSVERPVEESTKTVSKVAYPLANLNFPVPETIETSLTGASCMLRPCSSNVLSLYSGLVKTMETKTHVFFPSREHVAYIPWPRAISGELRSIAVVMGSSVTKTVPNWKKFGALPGMPATAAIEAFGPIMES